MRASKQILVVGTADTKANELQFLKQCIEADGARALVMDVGVGDAPFVAQIANDEVAAVSGSSIAQVRALRDENHAMAAMALGAGRIARKLHRDGQIDGLIALGGSMGTDLALDVAAALPLGVPKVVVSTIAFSHLIPPQRLAPDLMMILWAGGLYGLNEICKSALSQAAGAVIGAARRVVAPQGKRPSIGITSFGASCLRYMLRLVPELEARGYEAAVFHATGMGGRAFEALVSQGRFAAVFDFAVQEVTNHHFGSVVSAGPDRLTGAGSAAIPQIVAPGALDLVDVPGWRDFPETLRGRRFHAHNRLLSSTTTTVDERRTIARIVAERLNAARGPAAFMLPRQGFHEWDRIGGPLRDEAGIAAMVESFRTAIRAPVELIEVDAHINDAAFVDAALARFDGWVSCGLVPPGQTAHGCAV